VANLAARNRFAVTWVQDTDGTLFDTSAVKVQFVEAATGALSAVTTPASVLQGEMRDPDVCGEGLEPEYSGDKTDLVIVLRRLLQRLIRLVHGAFNASDVLAWDAPKTIFTDDPLILALYSQPTIAAPRASTASGSWRCAAPG
jgi:hypothetical protein